MTERVGAYTPETARAIAEFVRGARRKAPRPRIDWHEVGTPQDRVIRWGRTTTSYYYPTYPTSGGVYVVKFGEYQPDTLVPGDTPDKTFTPYDPEDTAIAVDPTGATIAEDTVVRCELHDGQWWIRPSGGTSWPLVRLYSGSFKSQYSDTSLIASGYPADCKFTYYNGDASECGLTITGDGASAYNDPLLTCNESGLYLLLPKIAGSINFTGSVPFATTVTTSDASAGTSHTHDVECPIEQFAQLIAYVYKRASGGGSWGGAVSYSLGNITTMTQNQWGFTGSGGRGSSMLSAPMYVRNITAGDELLLRCYMWHTADAGTPFFYKDVVELTIIKVSDDDAQNTVT